MGKKQHQKDRLYLTAKEHKEEWGGYKEKKRVPFQRLPFHCCAITFTPFEDPVCTDDGTTFDIVHIVPYIKKFGRHPVKGTPLELADLIQLNFHKNGGEHGLTVAVQPLMQQLANIKRRLHIYMHKVACGLVQPKVQHADGVTAAHGMS